MEDNRFRQHGRGGGFFPFFQLKIVFPSACCCLCFENCTDFFFFHFLAHATYPIPSVTLTAVSLPCGTANSFASLRWCHGSPADFLSSLLSPCSGVPNARDAFSLCVLCGHTVMRDFTPRGSGIRGVRGAPFPSLHHHTAKMIFHYSSPPNPVATPILI